MKDSAVDSQQDDFKTSRELIRDMAKNVNEMKTSLAVLATKQEYNDKNFERFDRHISNDSKNKWTERIINGVVAMITAGGIHFGAK